jgi:hypothetical protein
MEEEEDSRPPVFSAPQEAEKSPVRPLVDHTRLFLSTKRRARRSSDSEEFEADLCAGEEYDDQEVYQRKPLLSDDPSYHPPSSPSFTSSPPSCPDASYHPPSPPSLNPPPSAKNYLWTTRTEEMSEFSDFLAFPLSDVAGPSVLSIHGPSATGKTALVLDFLRSHPQYAFVHLDKLKVNLLPTHGKKRFSLYVILHAFHGFQSLGSLRIVLVQYVHMCSVILFP